MTTSDRVLTAMAHWLESNDFLPMGVTPRLRDYDGPKGVIEVCLDADAPEEHEVLRGVDTISGEIVLDVSVDDTEQEERQEWLEELTCLYDVNVFLPWVNDAAEDRGLNEGDELRVYDLRMGIAGRWDVDGRRQRGTLEWEVVAAPVAAP